MRRAEAAGLRWCDLQPRVEAGQVTVFGKGGKNRAVLVPSALWSDLLELRGGASSNEPVLPAGERHSSGQTRRCNAAWRVRSGPVKPSV